MNRQTFRKSLIPIVAILLVGASLYVQAQPAERSVTASVWEARQAGVAESVLNQLLILAADHRLEDDGVVRLVNFVQMVQAENLPIGPFMGKIEEGLAKQIPLDTIAAVLTQKLDDYRFVRKLLRTKTGHQEISHQDLSRMVDSLDGGIARDELARFLLEAPGQDPSMLARASEILALLKQIRFNQTLTQEILFTGLENNSLGQSWDYLARVVATAKGRHISEDEIARAAQEALQAKRPFKDFMANLGFTPRDLQHGPAMGR